MIIGETSAETYTNILLQDRRVAVVFNRLRGCAERVEYLKRAMVKAIEHDSDPYSRQLDTDDAIEARSIRLCARHLESELARFDTIASLVRTVWSTSEIPTLSLDHAINQVKFENYALGDSTCLDTIADVLSTDDWHPSVLADIADLVRQTGRTWNNHSQEEGETK